MKSIEITKHYDMTMYGDDMQIIKWKIENNVSNVSVSISFHFNRPIVVVVVVVV